MKRTRLEELRVKAGLSKSKLARMADINPASICYAEQRGFQLYPIQCQHLAEALCWTGDPEALLEDVGTDVGHA